MDRFIKKCFVYRQKAITATNVSTGNMQSIIKFQIALHERFAKGKYFF